MERKTHRESWKGEESVKERFTLPESRMVPFLEGEYTLERARADLAAKVGRNPEIGAESPNVVPIFEGEYTIERARADLAAEVGARACLCVALGFWVCG